MNETAESLTDEKVETKLTLRQKFGLYLIPMIIGLVFILSSVIPLILFIVDLASGENIKNISIIAIISAILLVLGICFILFGYIPYRVDFKGSEEDIQLQLENYGNLDLSKTRDRRKFSGTYYSLLANYPEELAKYMSDNLEVYQRSVYIPYQGLNQMLYTLAIKLGYSHSNEMLAAIRGEQPKEIIIKEEIIDDIDLSIPITKVYFIDKLPADMKSMVSGLPIDIKMDIIVACPNCGNMAERNLLEKWLKKNKKCPICKKSFDITDLPLVKVDK